MSENSSGSGLVEAVERWRSADEAVAVATVVATRRSAPRPVGSKLAVSSGGELAGSVSGGCVEGDVFEHAREVLRSGRPRLVSYAIEDEQAWGVGLPCGGEIDIFVELLDAAGGELSDRIRAVTERGERAAVFTVIEGEPLGAKTLVLESGERLGDGVPSAAVAAAEEIIRGGSRILELENTRVFADVYGPPPRLVVVGAVDTAEALAAAAKLLRWETIVVDARPKFATRERIPHADRLIVDWPEEALGHVQPDHATAIVVLTHDDKFDVPALKAALASDAFYVGALGSRRNQERRRQRLLEEGVPPGAIDRIAGPAGLDLGGESQEETALSILGEIVACRFGRSGGRLRDAKQRIHAEVV